MAGRAERGPADRLVGAPRGPAREPLSWDSPSPYEAARVPAAAIYCSDGRLGEHIDEFLHRGLGLPRYDRIAVPGGAVHLAGHLETFWEGRGLEEQIRFLVRAHQIRQVVLIAHEGCGYYRERLKVPDDAISGRERDDLRRAADALQRIGDRLAVRAFQARIENGRVRFEEVPLAI